MTDLDLINFDYIIVGAGSAGCVLAERLSADPKNKVCLLEAGPSDKSASIRIPLGVVALMRSKKFNWLYDSHPEKTLNQRQIFNPRGKTLGGSSSVNAMLYIRGQRQDYDHWESLGNAGWGWEQVLPYFKATQNQERGESEYHGVGGGLNVAENRSQHPIANDFITAAHNAGFPLNPDFNGETQEGIGQYQVTQKDGQRHSAAKGFLHPIINRANLTVKTGVNVCRLLINGQQVTGVEYRQNGQLFQLNANKEVILSAGAFNSPQILLLSGIGEKSELEKLGIEVKHHLSGVGKNLQDHVDALIVREHTNTAPLSIRPLALLRQAKCIVQYLANRVGLLTSPVAESGGFIKTDASLETPDIQLHFVPGGMNDHGRDIGMLFSYSISLHVCLLRPQSRGQVSLYNNNPNKAPKIESNMLQHPEDVSAMIKAVKIARTILDQQPLLKNKGKEIFPPSTTQTDQEIETFLREKSNTIYHPVGTCKMGNDEMSVVDERLRVHGLKGLRVVDA
jgi:choline dehydrogenase-like flavoprotein